MNLHPFSKPRSGLTTLLLVFAVACATTPRSRDLPFFEVPGLGELWVAPGTRIATRDFEIVEWLPPELDFAQIERGKVLEAKVRARKLSEAIPEFLRSHLADHPNRVESGAEIRLTGRFKDSQPGRLLDLMVAGRSPTWSAFDLLWVDAATGKYLAVLSVRLDWGETDKALSLTDELANLENWVKRVLAPALGSGSGASFLDSIPSRE
jgi:hypothetical protein